MSSNFKKMPRVDADGETQMNSFANARKLSRDERAVSIVTPGRMIMPVHAPEAGSMQEQMVDAIKRIVPNKNQNISVIANNNIVNEGAFTTQDANKLIPFLGYLMGMVYIGNNVLVFEGHESALEIACKDANLLILDESILNLLHRDWIEITTSVMTNPRILIFGLDGSLSEIDIPSDTK